MLIIYMESENEISFLKLEIETQRGCSQHDEQLNRNIILWWTKAFASKGSVMEAIQHFSGPSLK